MRVKILHCADLHLDKTFDFPRHEHSLRKKEDLEIGFQRIIDYAVENKADLVLMAGDIFDRVNPSNEARLFFAQQLRRLQIHDIRVILIAGNHDVPKSTRSDATALDIFATAGLCDYFRRVDEFDNQLLEINGTQIHVIGKSYNPRREKQSPLEESLPQLKGDFNFLMVHGSYQGNSASIPQSDSIASYHPVTSEQLDTKINYLALGHLHNGQIVKLKNGQVVGTPGSIELLSLNERDYNHGFIWIEIDRELHAWHIPLQVRESCLIDVTLSKTTLDINESILQFLEEKRNPDLQMWLELRGEVTPLQYQDLDLRYIYDNADPWFFTFHINHRNLSVEGHGHVFRYDFQEPKELFAKRIERLLEDAANDREKELLQSVSNKGLELLSEES